MPMMMPPLGESAVPLPKKKLKMLPEAAAVADAVGAAEPPTSAPVEVDAAAALAVLDAPNSRREAASAVQASGASAGASPVPPVASHDSRLEPTPATEVDDAAARGAALAAGAAETASTAAAGAATAGASLLTAGVASEGGETTVRGAGASVTASLAEPELPADGTDGVTTGAVLLRVRGVAAAEEAPLRGVLLSAEVESLEAPPRLPPRRGEVALDCEDEAPLDAWSLVEPDEPVVSAYAIGIAEIAEPMPSAIASAPTRPIARE